VVYPNTVPPFFPSGNLVSTSPTREDYPRRLAGLRAHNRWMAEWCAELPLRRAGIGQILLNDVDDAVHDVHWIADHGLRGGVLLPGIPPGAPVEPLHSPAYDPVWRACEERGLVVNAHGGGSSPDYGMYPASLSLWLMETAWFSHRPLWSFILAGVFDRFPNLRMVLAEQGTGWIRSALDSMDAFYGQLARGNVGELTFVQPFLLDRMPSEYWQANCFVGASFYHRADCIQRAQVGADRVMWGSDYPHLEGTPPFSKEAIALTFEGVDPVEVRAMLGGTAAEVYGFDLAVLEPLAAEFGPRVDDVFAGLDVIPDGVTSPAFSERPHQTV
jgi:predicted TIM-barrel fold metal-dependent hydrolase